MRAGHETIVWDRDAAAIASLVPDGAAAATSLADLADQLGSDAIFWVMLPAGDPTETTIEELGRLAEPGAIIIDGGNSFYKDDIRRAKSLAARGIDYVDVGTSGGVWGLERGFCMMIGGREEIVRRLDPIFDALAPGFGDIARTPGRDRPDDRAERGYIHAGPPGARTFRQDGPQRHRIWPDAGLCRGLRHPQGQGVRNAARGGALHHRPSGRRRGLAARQRHLLLAARPHRRGARQGP